MNKKVVSLTLSVIFAFTIIASPINTITANAICAGLYDGSYGFFYSRGSLGAMDVLEWGVNEEGSTVLNGSVDATRLDLMLESLDYIDECNFYRATEGIEPLKVCDYLMAVAEVQLNWSDTSWVEGHMEHSWFYSVAENLARGYKDPFTGWYTAEKKLYDSGEEDMLKVGHYENISNDYHELTGFAISLDGGRKSFGQTFEPDVYDKQYQEFFGGLYKNRKRFMGDTVQSVSDYRNDLLNYIFTGGLKAESLIDNVSVDTPLDAEPIALYRLYNRISGEHLYTTSEAERQALLPAGWDDEGFAWNAPTSSNTPVYRMYNKNTGDHHYTINYYEVVDLLNAGWSYEGIGWYSDPEGHTGLYRLYNPNTFTGAHHYTADLNEVNALVAAGWSYEGIAWYGV